MAIIYLLTNQINMKRYVGKTVRTLEIRWQGHLGSARRGDSDMLVCRAIKKYGPDTFERTVLQTFNEESQACNDRELAECEKYWIRELGTHVSQGGYNLTFGGDGGLPEYKFSEASKEKIRQKALGRKHSEETRAKMSAAKLGKKQSAEHVAIRVAKNTGKKRTEEQCARISDSLTGRSLTEETRKKISDSSRGRVTSESAKEKFYKAVEQLTLDGTLIVIHKSLTDASKAANLSKGAMSGVVKTERLHAGHIWRYQTKDHR